ncbi:MAG: hypothetical protein ACD_62C00119G0001, partial [uncultured bacterium]
VLLAGAVGVVTVAKRHWAPKPVDDFAESVGHLEEQRTADHIETQSQDSLYHNPWFTESDAPNGVPEPSLTEPVVATSKTIPVVIPKVAVPQTPIATPSPGVAMKPAVAIQSLSAVDQLMGTASVSTPAPALGQATPKPAVIPVGSTPPRHALPLAPVSEPVSAPRQVIPLAPAVKPASPAPVVARAEVKAVARADTTVNDSFPKIPDYKILRQIGQGSFSKVYLAESVATGEKYAIKVLSPGLVADPRVLTKFYKEAVAYQTIASEHVVKLHSFVSRTGEPPYMILEYVPGGTMLQWSAEHRDTKKYHKQFAEVMLACAKGIIDINQAGLLHRDIKPDNIFMTTEGTPKIGDLGLSKVQAVQTSSVGVGTLVYQSPEQLTSSDIDVRSDLYSLGATMYYAFTGQAPYYGTPATQGDSIKERALWLLSAPQLDPWVVNKKIPEPLRRIILLLTMRDRNDRYQTPEELVEDLGLYLKGKTLKHATRKAVAMSSSQLTLVPPQKEGDVVVPRGSFMSELGLLEDVGRLARFPNTRKQRGA